MERIGLIKGKGRNDGPVCHQEGSVSGEFREDHPGLPTLIDGNYCIYEKDI
jgi:hypothetical protein